MLKGNIRLNNRDFRSKLIDKNRPNLSKSKSIKPCRCVKQPFNKTKNNF